MSELNDGGPAFPRPSGEARDGNGNSFWPPGHPGMTLRDWFAGQALAGMFDFKTAETEEDDYLANIAYKIADAMIAERDGKAST